MLTKTLQREFPGIYALFGALKRAWKACLVYNKAIEAVKGFEHILPINEWAQTVSERSQLSYEEAYRIYTVITEETDLCKSMQRGITEFVVEMAKRGHTAEMIISYLRRIDRELDKWVYNKLRMR